MNTQSDDVSTRVSKITRAARAYASDMTEARRDLFQSFCRVVAPQLRASYVARHGAKKVPQELMSGFEMLVAECSTGVLQVRVEPRADGSAVVRTNMRDQPFIVDTVRLLIDSLGASIVDGFSAVVAVQRGPDGELEGLGVARFIRDPDDPGVAEPAIAVVDAWQGRGVGRVLTDRLVDAARERGIRELRCTVLPFIQAMLAIFKGKSTTELRHVADLVEVRIPLTGEAASRASSVPAYGLAG